MEGVLLTHLTFTHIKNLINIAIQQLKNVLITYKTITRCNLNDLGIRWRWSRIFILEQIFRKVRNALQSSQTNENDQDIKSNAGLSTTKIMPSFDKMRYQQRNTDASALG